MRILAGEEGSFGLKVLGTDGEEIRFVTAADTDERWLRVVRWHPTSDGFGFDFEYDEVGDVVEDVVADADFRIVNLAGELVAFTEGAQ